MPKTGSKASHSYGIFIIGKMAKLSEELDFHDFSRGQVRSAEVPP